jgi:UDP-galactopyranose mutase
MSTKKIQQVTPKNIKLEFYKRNGYYKLRGTPNLEFCYEVFKERFNIDSRYINIDVTFAPKRGYTQVDFIYIPHDMIGIELNGVATRYKIWSRADIEIKQIINTSKPFFIKVTKRK